MRKRLVRQLTPVPFTKVKLADRFWAPRQEINRRVTIPIEYEQCRKTGRIDAFRLDWKKGQPNEPHIFWDSDVGKWIEAAAYAQSTRPDARLKRRVEGVIDLIAGAQQPDGYLNVHYTVVEPDKRWSNLRDCHELYCAGHLIEGAVAWYEATGQGKLLDVMRRYADYIDSVFGADAGKKRGYCGHPEVELALVKLYRATGEPRYLKLAAYFVNERGRQPHYFDIEARGRGENPSGAWFGCYAYCQAHKPLREQTEVVGHAVRAMYIYSAMADVANETGDASLLRACERLWESLCRKRLYITGGIGPSKHNEGFTFDYDLPNETAYAETCAAIGLVFWNHRLLQFDGDGRYADIIERALYNGTISGVALDGRTFFYANPLTVFPAALKDAPGHIAGTRQKWFGCACCPPNIARLIASVGQYVYSQSPSAAYVHLYAQGSGELEVGGRRVVLKQRTDYPWSGDVRIDVDPERPMSFTLALRIPGWCRRASIRVNGRPIAAQRRRGYALIRRTWRAGDTVALRLDMPVERVEANPLVRMDCRRIALQRGPVVYCLEGKDNGANLTDLLLPRQSKLSVRFEPQLLGGVATIEGVALRRDNRPWQSGDLYRQERSPMRKTRLRAVPYCVWSNRGPGEMLVWIRE